MNWSNIRYFKQDEFRCKCCGKEEMQQHFVEHLDEIRYRTGLRMVIHSGYRCEKHDAEVNGKGNHSQGCAADIECIGMTTRHILLKHFTSSFPRVGVSKNFIHVDECMDHPGGCWVY